MGAGRQTDQGKVRKVMTSYDIVVSCGISLVNFVLKKFNNCIHTKPILKTYSFSSTINRRVRLIQVGPIVPQPLKHLVVLK